MKQALILHGTDASPEANWFHWLEDFLADSGYSVWLPQLPDSATPNTKVYNDFLFGNRDFQFNQDTMLVGHSSGAVEILSLLQHLPDGIKVGDVYLVSAFRDGLNWDALEGLFIEPYDYKLIQSKARSITLIHSDTDPYVPFEQAHYLANELDARLLMVAGQGHFNLEQGEEYHRFPLLAQIIETTDILENAHKLKTFRAAPVEFVETQVITDGVECDVYSFENDDAKDLGIIRIKKGFKTPKQIVLQGDKTIEGFLVGAADLSCGHDSDRETIFSYSDNSYGSETAIEVGEWMQWSADGDSVLYEICYPPYKEGRFENQQVEYRERDEQQ